MGPGRGFFRGAFLRIFVFRSGMMVDRADQKSWALQKSWADQKSWALQMSRGY